MSKYNPFISVIIPVKAINNYIIDENLPALGRQSYKEFEAIILPNRKSDKDAKLLKKYPWLRIHPTNYITRPAQKRDIGAKKARGDILSFIDDDAYPTNKWLENVVAVFEKNDVDAICGPGILPIKTSFWERVFDEILVTRVGSGEYAYRFKPDKQRYVDDYPSMNFLIKKDIFWELGGFDNNYWPGEDSKLCEDLVYKKKGKILYDPSIIIYHHRRDNLKGFLEQHGNYGFHRGAFFAHGDKNSRRLSYVIPTFFVSYLFIIALCFPYTFLYPRIILFHIPLYIYLFFAFSVLISALNHSRSLKIAVTSTIVLFLMHLVYGVRFIQGFFTGLTKKEKIY